MADFTTALGARLLADGDTTALAGTRIHWSFVPQGTVRPYVRLQVISDPRPQHLRGYQGTRVSRVQADCFAETYGAARTLAQAIIAAVAQPASVAGVNFGRGKGEGPFDRGEDVTGKGFVHRAQVDLLLEHDGD